MEQNELLFLRCTDHQAYFLIMTKERHTLPAKYFSQAELSPTEGLGLISSSMLRTYFVRIDRRRKIPVSTLLFALGLSQEDICSTYYKEVKYRLKRVINGLHLFTHRGLEVKPPFDLIDADTGEVIAEAEKKITPRFVKEIEEAKAVKEILVPFESIIGRFASNDIVDEKTGEIWLEAGEEII